MTSFERNEMLLGKQVTDKIYQSTILLVGLGGVGSFACEAIARLGFHRIVLIDHDIYESSNLNRQLGATTASIGRSKVEVMKERILLIHPEAEVIALQTFYGPTTMQLLQDYKIDYAIDAIDSIASKWQLIKDCLAQHITFVSSGGMACNPSSEHIKVVRLDQSTYDPISKVLRHYARQENIDLKQIPICINQTKSPSLEIEGVLPSIIFAPAISGLKCVEYIVQCITQSI